jgi:hypothetical protein
MSRQYEEHQVAKSCIEYLHRVHPGVATWRHDGGDYAPPQVRQREREAGGRVPGNTDVCIGIWGRTKKHMAVEFKPPQGGVVTATQKQMHSKLERSGFSVFVVRSLADFIEALEEHGTAPPEGEGDEAEAEEHAPPRPPLPPAARSPPRTLPAGGDAVVVIDCMSEGAEEAQRARRDGEAMEEAPRTPAARAARTPPPPTPRTQPARGVIDVSTSDGEEEAQRAQPAERAERAHPAERAERAQQRAQPVQPLWQGMVLPMSWSEAMADGRRRARSLSRVGIIIQEAGKSREDFAGSTL